MDVHNMATDAYMNTYRTYKAGTTRLTTWLIRSGLKIEADLGFNHSEDGDTIQVPINQLTRLARLIVDSQHPKIRIPQSIISVTRIVIDLRRQTVLLFERSAKNGKAMTETVEGGHQHFISVLEEVLEILQSSTTTTVQKAVSTDEAVSNMFAALRVEEPILRDSLDIPKPQESSAASKPKKSDAVQYELEASSQEYILSMLEFFKDLHEIRDYLKGVWRDYRKGDLDLMAAAVTTDTAMILVKQSLQDISDPLLEPPSYASVTATLTRYMDTVGGPTKEFYQLVFLDAADCLHHFMNALAPGMVPTPLPQHFDQYDPKRDRSSLTEDQKQQEDRIILLEWLSDIAKITQTRLTPWLIDELTAGLQTMIRAGRFEACPPHAVFGTQIFLDIHHVLREEAARPFSVLQDAGARVTKVVDDYFQLAPNYTAPSWHQENELMLLIVGRSADLWTRKDTIGEYCSGYYQNNGHELRPFSFLKIHPILCGLMTFRFNMIIQQGGIMLCNAWGSVLYQTHLYNAACRSADMKSKWGDIEYIISLNSPEQIFVGSPPMEPAEYPKRLLLASGASAATFAQNRRRGGDSFVLKSKKGPRGLKYMTPVRKIFGRLYEDNTGSAALTTSNIVAMLSVAIRTERTRPMSIDLQSFAREMVLQPQYSPIQILKAVREGIAAEEVHLLFDYFGVHWRALELQRTLRRQFHSEIVQFFGEDPDDESQMGNTVGCILGLYRDADRRAKSKKGKSSRHGDILQKAAETMEQYINDDDNGQRSITTAKALSGVTTHA